MSPSDREGARANYQFSALVIWLLPILIAATICIFYLIPEALKFWILRRISPLAVMLFGDSLGCAVIAWLFSRAGTIVYAAITTLEYIAFQQQWIHLRELIWLTDLIPTLFLIFILASRAISGRNWRRARS